jgi:D-3-phosphoglycerate dehydrogenase
MINKSKGDYAYTMVDCDTDVTAETVKIISDIEGVIRVRVIK